MLACDRSMIRPSRQLALDFAALPEPETLVAVPVHSFANVAASVAASNVVAAHYIATDDDLHHWFYRDE
jgi:hypothetical protein